MTFIQLPLFGIDFNQDGNIANRVKGKAKAMAKPNMPMAGPMMLPEVETSTNKKPMMGPVHEKDTNVNVKAIRKMLRRPVVFSALLSTALLHEAGNVISKAPKNDAANTTNIKKNRILNTALVERAFSALAPKISVTANPKIT